MQIFHGFPFEYSHADFFKYSSADRLIFFRIFSRGLFFKYYFEDPLSIFLSWINTLSRETNEIIFKRNPRQLILSMADIPLYPSQKKLQTILKDDADFLLRIFAQ